MRRLIFTLLALFLSACSGASTFTGQCSSNSQCPVGAFCNNGLCACRSDEACKEGEFCNGQGVCQKREGCSFNSDCDAAKFCDLASGECIDRASCGSDVHCTAGSVCDPAMMKCVDGCHDTSDCPLYTVCQGASGTTLGSCIRGKCGDKSFCAFREKCTNGACVRDQDPQRPLCDSCNNMPGDCGSNRNYCLVNANYVPGNPSSGSQYFCAPECQSDNDCPNGYSCGGVVLLTQDLCLDDSSCGGGGRKCQRGEGELHGNCSCVMDSDCTVDAIPAICAGTCRDGINICRTDNDCLIPPCNLSQKVCQNPMGTRCQQDTDCMQSPLCQNTGLGMRCVNNQITRCSSSNDCLCNNGTCFGTGRPCNTAAECQLTCVMSGGVGGCLLGSACAPDQGLSCAIVH